jgi:hypothetical protein
LTPADPAVGRVVAATVGWVVGTDDGAVAGWSAVREARPVTARGGDDDGGGEDPDASGGARGGGYRPAVPRSVPPPPVAVPVRLRWHPPTRAYLARRTEEGLSKREIICCLKRYVAREVFTASAHPPLSPTPLDDLQSITAVINGVHVALFLLVRPLRRHP